MASAARRSGAVRTSAKTERRRRRREGGRARAGEEEDRGERERAAGSLLERPPPDLCSSRRAPPLIWPPEGVAGRKGGIAAPRADPATAAMASTQGQASAAMKRARDRRPGRPTPCRGPPGRDPSGGRGPLVGREPP